VTTSEVAEMVEARFIRNHSIKPIASQYLLIDGTIRMRQI